MRITIATHGGGVAWPHIRMTYRPAGFLSEDHEDELRSLAWYPTRTLWRDA